MPALTQPCILDDLPIYRLDPLDGNTALVQKVLNLHNWICELPQAVADDIAGRFVTRKLSDGEFLYHQGDPPDACFQVGKGRLKICNYNHEGQEILHAHLVGGDCVGDWALILDQPRMNNAISCGESEVNSLRKHHFNELYERYPDISRALNRVMARRLRFIFMLSEDASLLPLRQRLARAIIRIGHSLGRTESNGVTVIENLSQEELAKVVGSTRPSVGRELKKLEQEGHIQTRYGKLLITNLSSFSDAYDRLLSVEPVAPDYS